MNHFLTVFYCSPILLQILQMMACCLSLRHPDMQAWVMVNRHHKKASHTSVKPFCVEKNIPQGRHSVLPLILLLAVMLFVFHFSVH